jgi:hypothetical protein
MAPMSRVIWQCIDVVEWQLHAVKKSASQSGMRISKHDNEYGALYVKLKCQHLKTRNYNEASQGDNSELVMILVSYS